MQLSVSLLVWVCMSIALLRFSVKLVIEFALSWRIKVTEQQIKIVSHVMLVL